MSGCSCPDPDRPSPLRYRTCVYDTDRPACLPRTIRGLNPRRRGDIWRPWRRAACPTKSGRLTFLRRYAFPLYLLPPVPEPNTIRAYPCLKINTKNRNCHVVKMKKEPLDRRGSFPCYMVQFAIGTSLRLFFVRSPSDRSYADGSI